MECDDNNRSQGLFFDPTDHHDKLKAFNDFTQMFELRYEAQFPEIPKNSLHAALSRWKISKATDEHPNPKPTLKQYDEMVTMWRSKDKVSMFHGMFSSPQLVSLHIGLQQSQIQMLGEQST